MLFSPFGEGPEEDARVDGRPRLKLPGGGDLPAADVHRVAPPEFPLDLEQGGLILAVNTLIRLK
jgi:hypothetical protein